MKKILFPTDFSKASDQAFVYALRFAKHLNAQVHVLHTFELPRIRGAHLPNTLQNYYEDYKLEEFTNFLDQIPHLKEIQELAGLTDVQVKYSVEQGDVVKTVILTAKKEESDLIVMGTAGAKGVKSLFVGTHAGEILENAFCPVLVIPSAVRPETFLEFERIALALGLYGEEEKVINWVLELGQALSTKINCFNIDLFSDQLKPEIDQLQRLYRDHPEISFEVVYGADIEDGIIDYAKQKQIDLLVMLAHRRNFIQEFFQGSSTKEVAYISEEVPVLVVQKHFLDKIS